MIDIQVSEQDNISLLEVSGRVDSMNAHELGQALMGAISGGRMRLVLDLSAVDYMSSAGLREIVSALKKLRHGAGDLRIAQPSHRVLEVLEMAGLDSIFQIYPSRAEAISSF